MSFDLIAKDLIAKPRHISDPLERANVLIELANNGFGISEICQELRALYDNTEDDTLRKQLLDMTIKVHGLYKEDDKKEIPKIIFNITADPILLNQMLCPPMIEA